MAYLRICLWNANGISKRKNELKTFLDDNNIDIMLLSETHLTNKNNFYLTGYIFHATNHPDGKAHGGTGILIKQRIKHHSLQRVATNSLQSTSIRIQTVGGHLNLAAIYCPPRFCISDMEFMQFFDTLGDCFIAGGDYNAKHPHWGSRLTNPKGRQLYNALIQPGNKLDFLSPGKPTYWPADPRKKPDLIDFAITRKIPRSIIRAEPLDDLSSDHSVVLLHLFQHAELQNNQIYLTSKRTNWLRYKKYISSHINIRPSINCSKDIQDAVNHLEDMMTSAAKLSTPATTEKPPYSATNSYIENLVREKRQLRREWQAHRSPSSKERLKTATRRLTKVLRSREELAQKSYIEQLSPKSTRCPLWKAHPNLKPPIEADMPLRKPDGSWARSDEEKASVFASHLCKVFTPNQAASPFILPELPIPDPIPAIEFQTTEITKVIKEHLKPNKSPGYDLIAPKMIMELPACAINYIKILFNSITKLGHFPQQWKKSIIIMIPKPGKDKALASSYRPISLLSCLSKLFEKLLLLRITPHMTSNNIIPEHQFGFREKHGTIEQVNRITSEIRTAYEQREYCSAIFLDISQAFDRVWLQGLMYKIKLLLPQNCHELLKTYLLNRVFTVKQKNFTTEEFEIKAGVPQGSVLGPTLYLLYTADIPTDQRLTMSTFADDTAILKRSKCPLEASRSLSSHLALIEKWMADWRIKINGEKSKHITFTLNRQNCPAPTLNNTIVPSVNEVTYLGVHLDRRLTWKKHIEAKRDQLRHKSRGLHWLINPRSPLRLEYKVLLYNSVIKPIWKYGSELWGNASSSNIDVIQRAQSKVLRTITGAPWYIRNEDIHRDLGIPLVKVEISQLQEKYKRKLSTHQNPLARSLNQVSQQSRLRRNDLPAR